MTSIAVGHSKLTSLVLKTTTCVSCVEPIPLLADGFDRAVCPSKRHPLPWSRGGKAIQMLLTPTQDSDFVQRDSKRENNWNKLFPKMPHDNAHYFSSSAQVLVLLISSTHLLLQFRGLLPSFQYVSWFLLPFISQSHFWCHQPSTWNDKPSTPWQIIWQSYTLMSLPLQNCHIVPRGPSLLDANHSFHTWLQDEPFPHRCAIISKSHLKWHGW